MSIDLKQDDEDLSFKAGGDLLSDDHRDDESICGAHGELLCLPARLLPMVAAPAAAAAPPW